MQQHITSSFQKYIETLMEDTYRYFSSVVKSTNRNCFHLACQNKYRACSGIMEYMFEELGDVRLQLDGHQMEYFQQVNGCFNREEDRVDPRLYEDTVQLIE